MGDKALTMRQQEVLDLLVAFQKERGYAPSNAELAVLMGARSPNAAADQLKALHRKGAITLVKGVSRGITINNKPAQRLVQINLNTIVKLKLTDAAIAELKRQNDELRATFPKIQQEFTLPATDENGMVSMHLWWVMNQFGPMCYCGADNPFEMHLVLENE